MGPSKAITFRSILPALVFIVALNLSYLVLEGPTRAVQRWRHFPAIFLFGLIAGLIYWRTRSIVPLFGAHGVVNALLPPPLL